MDTPKITWQVFTCITIHQKLSSMNLEGDTLLQLQKWWDSIWSALYQSLSTSKSCPEYKSLNAAYYYLSKTFSHQKFIWSQRQKMKTIRHSQDPFYFALSKMLLFIHQRHQNHMSNLSLTWILITSLTFFFLLYLQWVLNLEYLYPNHKTLWFTFYS